MAFTSSALFDRMVVINLPERVDRRKDMSRQLKAAGFGPERVSWFSGLRPSDAGPFPSIGARGCFLSHLAVLREAVSQGRESIVVLEDDVNFIHRFAPRAEAVLQALPPNWSILYAGLDFGLPATSPVQPAPSDMETVSAHFMCFRGEVIAALVDHLQRLMERPPGDPQGGPMHVDGAYHWFRQQHPQYPAFCATPALGYQRPSRSDIAELGLKDRLPLIRHVVAAGRLMSDRLRALKCRLQR
jgi:hypothetical protein